MFNIKYGQGLKAGDDDTKAEGGNIRPTGHIYL